MTFTPPLWQASAPAVTPALQGALTAAGSLTEYLQASGRLFAVDVLFQGNSTALQDEAALLGNPSAAYARHVALTLDGQTVVVARSVCRADCPHWQERLNRGRRSLGLTLFGEMPTLARGALAYARLGAGDPRHALAAPFGAQGALPARRCLFSFEGAPLIVTELFLPALELLTPCPYPPVKTA
ncbi:chorismate--pyruvate lyase family protein [Crenobacter caeni]|uniref:Chorismate lyase n=1 Tax=Crenobacter caeni TaxID=2705474 RepID=A0A6B2KVS8_9NEIS|nr:chorismate lyase [Crenobacter caeni]NDV14248.1 chorismate lyase [Crenobacter caeni]